MTRVDVLVAIDGEIALEQHLEVASFTLEEHNGPYTAWISSTEQIEVAPPDRIFTLDVHHAKPVEPPLDWSEDKFSLTGLFGRIPGQVALLMARWYPTKGWLVTRRGIVRHGQPGPIGQEVVLAAESGLIAMEHRVKQEGLEW